MNKPFFTYDPFRKPKKEKERRMKTPYERQTERYNGFKDLPPVA